jgi:DHA2 family multidrug resistance protein
MFGDRSPADQTQLAIKMLTNKVQGQAYLMSFIDVFFVLSLLFAAAAVAVALAQKPKQAPAPGDAH